MRELVHAHVRTFVWAAALAATATSPNIDAAVGRTAGSPGVSHSGEASYSIPIFAPPGTHGMTPQMALIYGHRSGSTIAGAGWSIAGLSAITRCQSSWAADGVPRDVRNDYSDRFCLNGNKLRLTSAAGTYGQAGATYRTELETFSRITSHGAAGNGPTHFIVDGKDGLIYEYGNTANSRIESVGQSTARAWALNRIRDRSENAIDFVYEEDTTNGAYRILRIEYTSNSEQSLTAAYRIEFTWEGKPVNEIDSLYFAGSRIKDIRRLDKIEVKYNTTLVRRYELTYEAAPSSTVKSRLQSVQECAGSSPDCFAPTTFTYQNGVPGLDSEVNTGAAVPATPWPIDVNGDGRDDLVYSSNATSGSGTWRVMLASGAGYGSEINTGITNTNYAGAIPIDYNADGLEDLLVPYSGGTWWVMLGSASGLSSPIDTGAPATATGTGSNARAFDVNGDGLDDLVWADLVGFTGGDAVRYRLRELSGAFSSTVFALTGPYPANKRLQADVFGSAGQVSRQRVPDLNGDGRGDLWLRTTTRVWDDETGWTTFLRIEVLCTGSWGTTMPNPNASVNPYFGDFNGDGKSDVLYLTGSGAYAARFGTGTGLASEVFAPGMGSGTSHLILDWDSDGYDDVLFASGGVWQVVRSTGEGFAGATSTALSAGTQAIVADLNGDGLTDVGANAGGTWRYRVHQGPSPDLLQGATDGFGNNVAFNYIPITQGAYTKNGGVPATFPEVAYQGPLHVVTSMSASNGIGGTYNQSFWYYYARRHLQGRGFEGFHSRRTIDDRNQIRVYEDRAQLFPHTGMVKETVVRQANDTTEISRVTNTFQAHSYGSGTEQRFLPFVSASTATRREVGGAYDGALVSTTTTTNSVDANTGTLYDTITTTTEAGTANGVQAGASYVRRVLQPLADVLNDTTNWCIGRAERIESTSSHNQYGGGALTRTTTVDWDAAECRPTQVTNEPGNGQLQVTRTFAYDGFGNVSSETVTGIGMDPRPSAADWGTTGQFPISATNALSQTTNLGWDYALGLKTSETDPNGIATSWQYDSFGRRTRENRPDLTATTWSYNDCATIGSCQGSNNKMVVIETALDAASSVITDRWVYTDSFDRPMITSARTLSGAYNRIAREYDALGRVRRESAPCWWSACTPVFWTTLTYDLASRVTALTRQVSDSDTSEQTTYSHYEGLTTRTVDALGKQSNHVSNVAGRLARSSDHDGYYQGFDYDAFGNSVRVTDSLGNTLLTNTFNLSGARTGQNDLVAGNWTYVPNALGETMSQTNANSQTTTFAYDLLGRLTSRVEPEGTSTFTFGISAVDHNIGRLASMSGPGYSEGFIYDAIGRVQTRTITSDATYSIDYAYNALGALHTLTYPAMSGDRFKLQYDYQNGLLLRVKDFNAPATAFWTANATDARGNLIEETLGNGLQTFRGFDQVTGLIDYIQTGSGGAVQNLSYIWDRVGNLTQRQDVRQGLTENFGYDNLHRLTSVTGPDPQTIGYDPRGNINSRSGNVGPSEAHTISWFSYNLPNTISASGNQSSQFFYGPNRARWKQVASYGGTSEQTIYIGGLIEKVTLGSVTSWKHYIAGGNGPAAVYTRKSTGTNELHYLTQDHLNSTDSVTSSTGAVEVRLSFGAFGQRRNEDTWSGNPTSGDWAGITSTSRRGFTSHEMLDNLNFTHMNGRVYDQLIGRFVSADPFIDGVGHTSGWNRYAYVANNPLSAIDPSGFNKDRANVRPRDGGGGDGMVSTAEEIAHGQGVLNWLAAYSSAMQSSGMAPVWSFTGRGWFQFNQMGGFRGATGTVGAQTPGTWAWVSSEERTVTELENGTQHSGGSSGFWELRSSILGPMFFGTDADRVLRAYLQARDGSPPWSGNHTWNGTFGRMRPDIMYRDGSIPPNLFEVKAAGSEAAGLLQLQMYLQMGASKGAVAGDLNLIFQGSESITLPGGWFSSTTYTFRKTGMPGVVTYTINSPSLVEQFEKAIQNNNNRIPGLPWLPPPIPVIP
jgi:RHS repeat-associated protein